MVNVNLSEIEIEAIIHLIHTRLGNSNDRIKEKVECRYMGNNQSAGRDERSKKDDDNDITIKIKADDPFLMVHVTRPEPNVLVHDEPLSLL